MSIKPACTAFVVLLLTAVPAARSADIPVKSGQKIAFLGDSITAMGAGSAGYCTLVVAGLQANGIDVALVPAGHSGDTSANMVSRLGPGVIDKKADWMTLSCGVNDVNNARVAVPLEKFKANTTQIVDRAQAAGIKVMILTATPNTETLDTGKNQVLSQYNDFLRDLAKQKRCLLADVNADFQKIIKEHKLEDDRSPRPGHYLLADALHPNFERGNPEMARTVLRTFGLSAAQMAKAEDAWLDLPGRVGMYPPGIPFEVKVSVRQETLLKDLAARLSLGKPPAAAARLLAAEGAGLAEIATAAEIEAAMKTADPKSAKLAKSDAERLVPLFLTHLRTLAKK